MATLASLIGKPLEELSEEELTSFIENLRTSRQLFLDDAYEARKSRRIASSKRKPKEMSAELAQEIDELMDLL